VFVVGDPFFPYLSVEMARENRRRRRVRRRPYLFGEFYVFPVSFFRFVLDLAAKRALYMDFRCPASRFENWSSS
jgi:hypothetical protein